MTEPVFQPRLLADGSLDPECLERMGPDWLTHWMRQRLSGQDPWFPIDRCLDEDPEALIVGLVRGLGSDHPLVPLLGRGTRRLLDETSAEPPQPHSYLRPLLRLCQQVALPETGAWFTAELETLAERPEVFAARWPEQGLTEEILFAALRQSPGWPGSSARRAWESLLTRPESTTFALSALGISFHQTVAHLGVWWRTCPLKERDLEFSQLISEALATEGSTGVKAAFGKNSSSFPPDLQDVIARELQAHGVSCRETAFRPI
jgi:hypothetical protein